MRIDIKRLLPLLVIVPLVGVGTAHLASNDVPPSSAGVVHVGTPPPAVP